MTEQQTKKINQIFGAFGKKAFYVKIRPSLFSIFADSYPPFFNKMCESLLMELAESNRMSPLMCDHLPNQSN